MPAVVAMPFVLIFGQSFSNKYCLRDGCISSIYLGFDRLQISNKKSISLWTFYWQLLVILFGFYLQMDLFWYLGQVSAYLFLTLTIYESVNKQD